MNIYVGNLSRDVTEDDLKEAFSSFGEVDTVAIIKDKFSGESRGFAFVEMPSKSEGQAAISALHGKDFHGKPLTVNEARPKVSSGGGGSRGGGREKAGFGGGREKRGRSW